jgi:cystathionine beta-lyase
MSFPTAPSIIEAIKERLKMPNFGYITHEKPAKEAIKKWHRIQRGENDITDEMIGFENGVLGGVATAVSAFTTPGDRILLHTPFYLGF